ncbi:MAG TPA: acyl-CoA thioesterase [Polyangiaceae bacterium]
MSSTTSKSPQGSRVTLHQLMLPEHGNALGNVHGGMIMKMVDEAGAIAAMRHAQRPCVTIAIDSMTFRQPVHLGELLVCDACVTYVGRTSIEVSVQVHAENPITSAVTHTNSAHLVYVALGEDGKPIEVPRLELLTDEEKRAWEEGELRQSERLARKQRETRASVAPKR